MLMRACVLLHIIGGYEAGLKDFKAWWCNFAAAELQMPCANRQSSFSLLIISSASLFSNMFEENFEPISSIYERKEVLFVNGCSVCVGNKFILRTNDFIPKRLRIKPPAGKNGTKISQNQNSWSLLKISRDSTGLHHLAKILSQ